MKKIIIFAIVIISSLLLIQNINSKTDILKIGFVAGISGKYSSLGTNVKNGVLLAFDDINYKIGNTKIELVIKDDKQEKQKAKEIINEFIKDDVKIILGNTTSSMTAISLDLINKEKDMLLFSPTASSNKFSKKDDNFIRTQVANSSKKFQFTAKYFLDKNMKNIIGIYDANNLIYSKGLLSNLEKAFLEQKGKKFLNTIKISDTYEKIKEKIMSQDVDLIVIVANSIDTAKLVQYLRVNNINKNILGSGWGRSQDFIEEGGLAVEGVLFASSYDNNSENKKYIDFSKKFEKKFNVKPSVFSVQSYEATKILLDTLKDDLSTKNLKKNIIKKSTYEGLQGEIIFDKYGDVFREYHLVSVTNGKFKRIK